METIDMTVTVRGESGKGVARSLRREGKVPAVLYGLHPAVALSAEKRPLLKLLNDPEGAAEHSLLKLTLEGAETDAERWAIIKNVQVDPVRNELLHVDFIEVSLENKVKIAVPLDLQGTPVGVKMGGVLQRLLREIEVECLPTQMPGTVVVDISGLEIGSGVHAGDLTMPEGVTMVTPPEAAILTVAEPRMAVVEEEEEVAAEEGEAAAPGEEAAPAKEDGGGEES